MSCSSPCAKPDGASRRGWLQAAAAAALALHLPPVRAQVAPAEVGSVWPQARLAGQGTLRVLGLRVYDARLWSPATLSADDWPQQPFALELRYARSLSGARIAQRSIDEIRRQVALDDARAAAWLALLTGSIPDVAEGDRLTGLHRPGAPARLFHNGRALAEWADAELVRRFFGIWLSPQTSDPSLRQALLGAGRESAPADDGRRS